jgi:DNA-binding transcriptional ArsR family regulator
MQIVYTARLEGESITVISQRLRVLRADNIVGGRREGKHILYFLSGQHVLDLVFNGLAHASEQSSNNLIQVAPNGALQRKISNVNSA